MLACCVINVLVQSTECAACLYSQPTWRSTPDADTQRSFAKLGALRQEALLATAREVAGWRAYYSAPGKDIQHFWSVAAYLCGLLCAAFLACFLGRLS